MSAICLVIKSNFRSIFVWSKPHCSSCVLNNRSCMCLEIQKTIQCHIITSATSGPSFEDFLQQYLAGNGKDKLFLYSRCNFKENYQFIPHVLVGGSSWFDPRVVQ